MTTPRDTHEPGEPHRYAGLECSVCGQPGTIRLTIDPEYAQPAPDTAPLDEADEPDDGVDWHGVASDLAPETLVEWEAVIAKHTLLRQAKP